MKQITVQQLRAMDACDYAVEAMETLFPEDAIPISQESLDKMLQLRDTTGVLYWLQWLGDMLVSVEWTSSQIERYFQMRLIRSEDKSKFLGERMLAHLQSISDEEFNSIIQSHIEETGAYKEQQRLIAEEEIPEIDTGEDEEEEEVSEIDTGE